ncbi:DNA cytosine methyltransferase [Rossellomorea aquimaris]|nr:DNA cytosine methyltransferase [Rossellomorea aquimaris]
MKILEIETTAKTTVNTPRLVDLFSGCGGLSYGFHLAGMEVQSGLEIDEKACKTASFNLHWKHGKNKDHLCEDIKEVKGTDLVKEKETPLITIGGPPCQAYSRIGKSKIRSLGEHRFGLNDNRAFLYKEFLRIAFELDSEGIVMENVPESVSFFGMNIPQIVCEMLEENGYNAVWTILNSADFGVPQTRERVFVMAIKKEIGEIRFLPEPTHCNPNEDYESRMKSRFQKFSNTLNFRMPMTAEKGSPAWVTVQEALGDLPALFPSSETKYRLNKMGTKLAYQTPPTNEFQKEMRRITENTFLNKVDGNCFRNTPRDFRIFENMLPGDDYRDALKIANRLFEEACVYQDINKNQEEEFLKLKKQYIPPYDDTKFHGKWRKVRPDKPSHTLVAHLGTDTYSHIHPVEPRGISVREAARLQSFPDDFVFNVPMGSAFKQIGNAVPPFLAKGIAKAIRKNINLHH